MKAREILGIAFVATAAVVACGGDSSTPTSVSVGNPTGFKSNPCSPTVAPTLGVAQSALFDCSGGGTTVTVAGGGASYLIVPQFASEQGSDANVQFNLASGTLSGSSDVLSTASTMVLPVTQDGKTLPARRNMAAQQAADRMLLAREHNIARSSVSLSRLPSRSLAIPAPPALGSIRSFHVASSFTVNQYKTIGASLAYAGSNVLIYIDTLAPKNGFTAAQFAAFGALFDQTLYPIDTTAFGIPTDLDGNGRVIMVMSPVVNADTPTATCNTQGFIAGFFDPTDFDGALDPNSNQGEVFYSIVPDPNAQFSCAHVAADLGNDVPATFLHELQHLIFFSQHVIISGTGEGASWLDEGLSIAAEELGSVYYEQKCPPPSCRTSPLQLFPDSSQGFISSFLYDSYQYALGPDTSSLTLHDDSQDGFSWRGGAWLLVRWIGDQYGNAAFKKLERGPADGLADVAQATGQTFPWVMGNFGLSLYTDSLSGLPRNTSANTNRFTTRNVKALWARLFATSGPAPDVPLAQPLQLKSIGSDTTAVSQMRPGAMKFFRLDTSTGSTTVTIRFATPGGVALSASLKPQLAIYRLPSGQ